MTLIPGDGIGPELAASVKEVFRYCFDIVLINIPRLIKFTQDLTRSAV